MKRLLIILALIALVALVGAANYATQISEALGQAAPIWYPNENNQATLVDDTWGVKVTSLQNCDLKTDGSGVFTCGVDLAGGGGSGGGWATTTDTNNQPGEGITYTTSDVYIGGTASNTTTFNFDPESSTFTISSTTAGGGQIDLGLTGVRLSDDQDGALTWLGLGDGFDEALTWNLDDVANTLGITSSTGLNLFNFGSIGLWSTASSTLSNLRISALRDSADSLGSNGMVLQSNGSTAQWVATSSLGIQGGASLSGGVTNALSYWTSATTLGNTTSPTVGFITATTTATSTFAGGIQAAGLYAQNFLQIGSELITNFTSSVRAAFSETVTGLTYNSGTGVLSLDGGYVIPLTASTTDWQSAFSWGNHATQNYFDKDTDSTTNITEGTKLFYTDARVLTYLDTLAKGYFFSTTSANFWETQQTARSADDLTDNQIDDLSDVAALSETTGDVLSWNGSAWIDVATSTLGFISQSFFDTFNNKVSSTSIDTLAEIETLTGVSNILIENDIDASSELAALMDDETGSGALVFATNAALSSTSLTNATATDFAITDGFSFGGVTGTTWAAFCTSITGSADLCDGSDASGGGGSGGGWATTTDTNNQVGESITYSTADVYIGGSASTTATFNFDPESSTLTISSTTASGGQIDLGLTGVRLTDDSDGAMTWLGLGNGFDEAITFNLDDLANTISLTSSTALDLWDFASIGINSAASSTLSALRISALRDSTGSLGTNGMVLQTNGSTAQWVATSTLGISGGGGVTSVDMTVPTGLSISGNPITTNGTLALTYAAGYEGFLTASGTNWNTFYNTPSNRITDGTGLTWSGNTLNCDTASVTTQGCITAADFIAFGNRLGTTSIDSIAELESITSADILTVTADDITSADLATLVSGETGTGALVFGTSATLASTTLTGSTTLENATSTNFAITNGFTFNGVTGTTWASFCTSITGSADLCDGNDASGGAATAGGSDTQLQFNDGGSTIGGAAGLVWNKVSGFFGVGSTTPGALLAVASTTWTSYNTPLFQIATSTDYAGQLLSVFATTTTATTSPALGELLESGVRIGIGSNNAGGFGLLDQLVVKGRINTTDWFLHECSVSGSLASASADQASACGVFSFQVDTSGVFTASANAAGSDLRITSATPAAANSGSGLFLTTHANSTHGSLGSTTPVMEAVVRLNTVQNATSSRFYVGFTNIAPGGTGFEAEPTAGCYFVASSTLANWQAQCRTSVANTTTVDTGVPSSTVLSGTGDYRKLKIYTSASQATFYIQGPTTTLQNVATISTNVPTVSLVPSIHLGTTLAGLVKGIDVGWFRVWIRKPLFIYP